jgi:hypothetical protein
MSLGVRALRSRSLANIGAAVYAVFLVIAPLGHHDLACHVKTPLHCASCTTSQLGSDPHPPVILGAWSLADAGSAVGFELLIDGFLLSARSTGRSPPVSF